VHKETRSTKKKKPYIQKANQEIFLVIFCFSS